jgi:hypothetical protein
VKKAEMAQTSQASLCKTLSSTLSSSLLRRKNRVLRKIPTLRAAKRGEPTLMEAARTLSLAIWLMITS